MSKLMTRLEKLTELQKRDNEIKEQMAKLNHDIQEFMGNELGLKGQATLVDIVKHALETTYEAPAQSIITSV